MEHVVDANRYCSEVISLSALDVMQRHTDTSVLTDRMKTDE